MRIKQEHKFDNLRYSSPGWYALSVTTMNFLDDSFMAREYMGLVRHVASLKGLNAPLLTIGAEVNNLQDKKKLQSMIKIAEDNTVIAQRIIDDGFHTIFCHAFISQYAAFEAGLENILIAILNNNIAAAERAVLILSEYKKKAPNINDYPWDRHLCKKILNNLQQIAIKSHNKSSCLQNIKLLEFFDFNIVVNELDIKYLDEANGVRNILLHDYGYVSSYYADQYEGLKEFADDYFVMTPEKLDKYSEAIRNFLAGLALCYKKSKFSDLN